MYYTPMVITHSRPDSELNLIRTASLISRRHARLSMVRYFTRAHTYAHIFSRAPRSSLSSHSTAPTLTLTLTASKPQRPFARHSLCICMHTLSPIRFLRAPSHVHHFFRRAPRLLSLFFSRARAHTPIRFFSRALVQLKFFAARAPVQKFSRLPFSLWRFFFRRAPRLYIFCLLPPGSRPAPALFRASEPRPHLLGIEHKKCPAAVP